MTHIFDASALIAYLKGETGAELTATLLRDRSNLRLAHAVNLCEVYYALLRVEAEGRARVAIAELVGLGLLSRTDIDPPFWRDVARIKADVGRVSLADCFGISLTRRVGGVFVTADHAEFDPIARTSICPVTFIR